MKINFEIRVEDKREHFKEYSNPPPFEFTGIPYIYFEGSMPIQLEQVDAAKDRDEVALMLGKQFFEQLTNYLQTQKPKEA